MRGRALTPSTGLTPAPVTLAPTTAPVSSPTAIAVLPTATPAPSPKPAPTEPAAPTVAPTPTDARFTEAQVIEVVDGDTIKVLVAGEKLTLRYIGIDTPEMSAADGAAARAQNIALVERTDRAPGAGRLRDRPVRPAAALRLGWRPAGQRRAGAPGLSAGGGVSAGHQASGHAGGAAGGS